MSLVEEIDAAHSAAADSQRIVDRLGRVRRRRIDDRDLELVALLHPSRVLHRVIDGQHAGRDRDDVDHTVDGLSGARSRFSRSTNQGQRVADVDVA